MFYSRTRYTVCSGLLQYLGKIPFPFFKVPVSVTQSWWSPSPESNSESFGVRLWNAALFSLPSNPFYSVPDMNVHVQENYCTKFFV